MKPEEFSPLAMYGNKDIFKKRLNDGYIDVAFGSGEWVNGERIVRLFVFYHPKNFFGIATYEHPKFDFEGSTIHGKPFESVYTKRGFERHSKKFKIQVGPKTGLANIVKDWEEEESEVKEFVESGRTTEEILKDMASNSDSKSQ